MRDGDDAETTHEGYSLCVSPRACIISFGLVAACHASSIPPATPATVAVEPPASQHDTDSAPQQEPATVAVEPPAPRHDTDSAPQQEPAAERPRIVPGEGCTYRTPQLDACRAMGAHCRLGLPPRASPCAGKGARCLEDPTPGDLGACECTCSEAYRRELDAVRDRSKEPRCRETIDLTTKKTVTICEPPELPR
jgi:hypothetical protein